MSDDDLGAAVPLDGDRLREMEADALSPFASIRTRGVLALVAALRASWAEVERLNGQLGDCIGCRYDEGPDEYCPQHGRTYTDVLDVTERMIRGTIAERDEARAALAAAERTLAERERWMREAALALDSATKISERMHRTGRVEGLGLGNHDRLVREANEMLPDRIAEFVAALAASPTGAAEGESDR